MQAQQLSLVRFRQLIYMPGETLDPVQVSQPDCTNDTEISDAKVVSLGTRENPEALTVLTAIPGKVQGITAALLSKAAA